VSLAKQIACWLLVFSLLGTQYSVAVWAQTSPPPIPPEENADPNAEFPLGDQPLPNPLPGSSVVPPSDTAASPQTILPSGAPDAGRAGFSCSNTVLDPRDRQALWDNTLYNGFVGRELSSGAPANKNRPKTDRDTVILPNAENKLAVKQTIPNQQIEPSEIAHLLNKRYNGAFAFGLEVEDSLRVGRCDDPAQSCALLGKALSYRNSGAGIVANVKNVYQDLAKAVRPDDENYSPVGFSGDEAAYVRAQIINAQHDDNRIEAQVANRIESKPIPNSILSNAFSASMNSNCTNATCTINTYSMFDKLFNAYTSTNMLIGGFGPTLLNQTRKAFGWTGSRLPFFKFNDSALATRIKSLYNSPDGWYGKYVLNRQYRRIQQEALPLDNHLIEKQFIIQGGGFNAGWNPTIEKELIPKYTTKEAKGKVYDYLAAQKKIADIYNTQAKLAQEELAAATKGIKDVTDPAYVRARIKAAGKMGQLYHEIDDSTGLDVPEWVLKHKSINWQRYAVKRGDAEEFIQPAIDSDFADILFQKLNKDGHFNFTPADAAEYKTYFESVGDKLVLYSPSAKGASIGTVTRTTIEEAAAQGNLVNAFAKLDDGTFVPFNKNNIKYILKKTASDVQLFQGGWEKAREISAEEMSEILLGPRVSWRTAAWARNSRTMLQWARENNWQLRKHYANWIDQAAAYEDQIIKSYLSPKGGLKWTAYPFAFWAAKRGVGVEDLSLYQLPDTWTSLNVDTGSTPIYHDAFIDFFANEGSDQGDVFVAFLNKLPWKLVLNKLSENFNPVHQAFAGLTENEIRNETGNLVTYVSGPKDCPTCGLTLQSKDLKAFAPNFNADQRLQTFILENTPADQKDVGQTLIAYTRHTNIKGTSKEIKNDLNGGIDLEAALLSKETCYDKVEKMVGGIPLVGALYPTSKFPSSAAAAAILLGFGENVGYALFTWGGFLGSAVQQILLAPQLQDCVDTQEGYFIHFFSPAPKKAKGNEAPKEIGTQKVADLVKNGTDQIYNALQGRAPQAFPSATPDGHLPQDYNQLQDPNWTQSATKSLKDEIDGLVNNAETKDLVEALVTTEGQSTGQLTGLHLFYVWIQGNTEANPANYRTNGKELISDGKTTVENDFNSGKVRINGKDVITNPDITRMGAENLAIPAYEYPNRLTRIGLPSNSNEVVFAMNASGDMMVLNSDVLNCLKGGVMEQTGVPLNSDNLSEVFGPATAIVTDTHPNIYPVVGARRIVAEGTPRQIAEGDAAKAEVLASTTTILTPTLGGDPNVGRMQSIQFQNGVIVYKPDTHELLVWLKRNQKAILTQNDVAGLNATKTTSKNPETGCDDPAINLAVSGNPNSELSQFKAGQFNDSLNTMGPYKIFDTPSKRFVLYSKLENGQCVPYFKVIDKATGEVLVDQPIKSIEQTPTGVKITTADGKDHTLDFSAENGRPILSYNGVDFV
jgi:hypothetical protein